jgi:hypothetical protein
MCEYLFILSNIAFNASAFLDFCHLQFEVNGVAPGAYRKDIASQLPLPMFGTGNASSGGMHNVGMGDSKLV